MGGKKHGNTLTPEEIQQARGAALTRAKKILAWHSEQSALPATEAE